MHTESTVYSDVQGYIQMCRPGEIGAAPHNLPSVNAEKNGIREIFVWDPWQL